MADVPRNGYGFRPHRTPRIEALRKTLESTCRTYDKGITSCIWLLGVLLFWCMIASTVVRVNVVEYSGALFTGKPVSYASEGRRDERTLHRVMQVLEEQCRSGEGPPDVVVGPQVHVDGKPYMKRVLSICSNPAVSLINPYIAVTGSETGSCIDEVDDTTRTVSRKYPITLHADNREPFTAMDLVDVCSLMQALDMLDGIW